MIQTLLAIETEPLAAQKIFSIGPLAVTNAMFFAVITAIFTIAVLYAGAKISSLYPKSRFAYYVELLIDGLWSAATGAFGDAAMALRFLPLLGTLFIFILIGNLTGSGMLPGVGTIQAHATSGQTNILLRPFTTDLNATLAMAILTIILVQYFSIKELGARGYFKHYFAGFKPMAIFIGINEVFGEFLKIVTLAMRLFGVIYAGEVLISAVAQLGGNFGWLTAVPTVLLEIFFSVVQAYVFMMLSATYFSVRLSEVEHGH